MTKSGMALLMSTLSLAVLSSPVTGHSQTVAATSCSEAAVSAAISSAGRNGTVTVPSGNCTWNTTLTITYGITLQGAGVDSTVVTSSGGIALISAAPDSTAISNSENIKITGFTFNGAGSSQTLLSLQGASGITGTKPYQYYIIGDNKFENNNPSSSTLVGACIQSDADGNGQLRGVIYHNTFDRCNILLRLFSNDDTREWSNTAFNQLAYGNEDSVYFEDNTIMYSSSYSGDNPGWIEVGQGGRLVARYNTWNLTNATTPQEVWDVHGFQFWNGTLNSGETGTMITEYYGNTLTNMGTYRWINDRSSWGLFFDNIMTGSGSNDVNLYGESPGDASCPSQIYPVPTNYNPLVNNTYFFNNTLNGNGVNAVVYPNGAPTSGCTVAENSNWWNYNVSCTASSCTAGVGEGTTPPTGTCTTGVGYWVASTPTPTASSSIIQQAAFYKCVATNTWQKYYTPYTYPHPLRSGSQVSPGAPSNLSGVIK
jgi:hypothetical protein